VPPNTPAVFIALVTHPVVAEHLGVEVVRLEGRVMDMGGSRAFEEEEAVVVNKLRSAVESHEDSVVHSVLVDKL
jgi:hypothetical protein